MLIPNRNQFNHAVDIYNSEIELCRMNNPDKSKEISDEEFLRGLGIDGDIVNDTFSSRAPKVKLNKLRFALRNETMGFVFKIIAFLSAFTLIFMIPGWYWISAFLGFVVIFMFWAQNRYLNLRNIEFQNAVLAYGIVTAETPLTVVAMSNLSTSSSSGPIWAVQPIECKSLMPLDARLGSKIPCVVAFQGDGFSAWSSMVSHTLSDGTGDSQILNQRLERLDTEAGNEWEILENLYKIGKLDNLPHGTTKITGL